MVRSERGKRKRQVPTSRMFRKLIHHSGMFMLIYFARANSEPSIAENANRSDCSDGRGDSHGL